jgi:C2 domain
MTRYQLSIYAEKLPKGFIFKPNPYATVRVTGGPRDGENIGTTEVVHSTQSPDFVKVFFIETSASINLPITISVYNDRDQSLLAEATFEATEVFLAPGHFMSNKANNGAKYVVLLRSKCLLDL